MKASSTKSRSSEDCPRLTEKALSQMNPVEAWFHILKNCATFTGVPEGLDPRLSPVMEAARSQKLSAEDRIQYFRAMVSEEDRQDIALAYLQRGLEQGKAEALLETARRMLSDGVEISTIMKYTGLSTDQIRTLAAN
jgi:hypothetical protein